MNLNIRNKKTKEGYIALMATIVISLVLLVMTVEESSSGWYSRFNILGTEAKEQATALAEGCAEQALANILTNPSYVGGATTTLPLGTCHIFPIQINYPTVGLVTIKTQAVVRGSYANLDMAMDMNDIHLGAIPMAPTTGTLFITTRVINDGGASSVASDFTMNVSANPNSTFAGSESGIIKIIQPGAYSVSETVLLPNYNKSSTGNCSGNIVGGEIKFCTITYDDVKTTLTVIANVINNDSGTELPANFPLFIDGVPAILGQAYDVSTSSHTVTATTLSGYAPSPWGYDCNASGGIIMLAGQNKTCIINFDDTPPPSPQCAETVMILDRTGSMSSIDLTNERNAAISLVNLYGTIASPPKVGVGSIGGLYGNTPAEVPDNTHPVVGWLTTVYSTITSAITTMTSSNSSVGSNLAAGITIGNTELNSARHVAGKEKVLILVSDGDPNEPSSSTAGDTGWKNPTNIASPNEWINPLNATSSNNTYATADDDDEDQGYRNFNFSVPSGATIQGIEVRVEGFSSVNPPVPVTIFSDNFGTGSSNNTVGNGWSESGNNSSNDGTILKTPTGSTNDTASPDGNRFALIEGNDGYICRTINTSGLSNTQLSYYWRGDSDAEDNENGIIEYRTSGSCGSNSGWNTLVTHELDNGNNNLAEAWSQNTVNIANNSNLIVRFHSDSNTENESFRIDAVTVTGTGAVANTSCQLQARIGDNSNLSSYKTATLTGTETTYTLGSSSDDWDNVSWSNTDFSDANFRLETRFNDPDGNCDSSAIANLDQLQTRVHYTIPTTPSEAALIAADNAKKGPDGIAGNPSIVNDPNGLDDTNVFTIHFGSDPSGYTGKELLANLANGTASVSGHQNGSVSNAGGGAPGSVSSFTTSAVSPNQFSNPTRAFTINDNQYATSNTNGNQQGYSGFSLNIPPGATINDIDVLVEAKSSDGSGCQVGVALSSNNGTSYTTADTASINSNDNTYTLDGTSPLWGRAWTGSDFDPSKFVVRLQNIDPGNSCSNGSTLSIDDLQVTVSYTTANLENSDGDNFFVAPTSSDMQSIFNYIGQQVCPALVSVTPPPPPTKGTINIITQVTNNNGGTATSTDLTINVSAVNPSQNSFSGSASGISITVDPGAYNITQNTEPGYTQSTGATCSSASPSSNISAGENRTCILSNDDIPPPPPPPNLNFDTNSWHEIPTAN